MPVEIQPRLILEGMDYGRMPPYWDDKPVARGLIKAEEVVLQQTLDLMYEWVNGTSISNAEGKNLDDIGYLWNVDRLLRNDSDYRQAILSVMLSSYDSGTITDVKRLIKNLTSPTYIATTLYPKTRFLAARVENTGVNQAVQQAVNKAVSSGARSQLYWEPSNVCLIPAIRLTGAPDDLLGEFASGTDTIGVELGGITDTLAVKTTSNQYGYFSDPLRSLLPFTLESAGTDVTLDFISGDGSIFPFDAIIPGGFIDEVVLSGASGSAVIVAGRTLALSAPV